MQVGSSTSNPQWGTSSAPFPDRYFSFINMVNYSKLKEYEVDFSTMSHNYSNPDSITKCKETFDPQGPLHIERPEKEMMMCIPKGV
jgi:hypothetical protein